MQFSISAPWLTLSQGPELDHRPSADSDLGLSSASAGSCVSIELSRRRLSGDPGVVNCWHGETLVVGRRQTDFCVAAEVTEGDLRRGSPEAPRLLAGAATPRQEATGEVGLARIIRAGVREDRPGLAKRELNGDTGRWAEHGLSGDTGRGRGSAASSLLLLPLPLSAADGSVSLDALLCATVVGPAQELLELLLLLLLLPPATKDVSAVVDCESDSLHFKWCSSMSLSAE